MSLSTCFCKNINQNSVYLCSVWMNLLYSAIYCRSLLLHNNATVWCCLYFCCCFCKKENGLGLFRFCVSMHFNMFVRDFNCIDSRLKHYLHEEENKLKRKMKNELIYPKFKRKNENKFWNVHKTQSNFILTKICWIWFIRSIYVCALDDFNTFPFM